MSQKDISEQQKEAKELYDKFLNIAILDDWGGMYQSLAQACAILAAEEIKRELEFERVFEKLDYWDEVIEQIKKL